MLPIIRRTRRPLTDPEVATIVPPSEIRSDSGQFRSDSSAPSDVVNQQTTFNNKLSTPSSGGEGRPALSSAFDEGGDEDNALQSTFNAQLSANPWSLQPSEPANDYQAFATWLQLPVPRTFRKAADALQCSVQRLRRLATRHNWRSRANAFDNHRASATSKALDQILSDELSDLKQRAERFRVQEWLLHEEMVALLLLSLKILKSTLGVPRSPS